MSRRTEVQRFVNQKITYIIAASGQAEGNAILAQLRRGVGHEPGEQPELFGVILSDMPDDFISSGTAATKEEWACYVALTLYALHQQGRDPAAYPMHIQQDSGSLGSAMAAFAAVSEDGNAKRRMNVKLQILATAKDMKEFSYHLRSVIQLLKSKGIPLNYVELAGELYEFQFPESRTGIFLKWGQDLYRNVRKDNQSEEDSDHE